MVSGSVAWVLKDGKMMGFGGNGRENEVVLWWWVFGKVGRRRESVEKVEVSEAAIVGWVVMV